MIGLQFSQYYGDWCSFALSYSSQVNFFFHILVELHGAHNHSTTSSHSLSKRDVGEEARDKLVALFGDGYMPSEAVNLLKCNIQQMVSTEYYVLSSADRHYVPDVNHTLCILIKSVN